MHNGRLITGVAIAQLKNMLREGKDNSKDENIIHNHFYPDDPKVVKLRQDKDKEEQEKKEQEEAQAQEQAAQEQAAQEEMAKQQAAAQKPVKHTNPTAKEIVKKQAERPQPQQIQQDPNQQQGQ